MNEKEYPHTIDCGDNSCAFVLRPAGGQRTNGGCRCLAQIYGHKRNSLLVREAQRHCLINTVGEMRETLQENVFATGQPGTWATKLDDKLAEVLHKIEQQTGDNPLTPAKRPESR